MQAEEHMKEALESLQEKLPKGLDELLEEYNEQFSAVSAIYDQLAYQQGMRDLMGFLIALIQ